MRVNVVRANRLIGNLHNAQCASADGGDVAEKRSDVTRPVLIQVLRKQSVARKWDPSAAAVESNARVVAVFSTDTFRAARGL